MVTARILKVVWIVWLCCACVAPAQRAENEGETSVGKLMLSSAAFAQGERIPGRYTCGGEGISPPLEWHGLPEGTRAPVLMCVDPDAPSGAFLHWLVYDIPADAGNLPEDLPPDDTLENGAKHGRNQQGRPGYIEPCLPGESHRYVFSFYALDEYLNIPARADLKEVLDAMEGHVLAKSELVGLSDGR